jgi:hypothetical protein
VATGIGAFGRILGVSGYWAGFGASSSPNETMLPVARVACLQWLAFFTISFPELS